MELFDIIFYIILLIIISSSIIYNLVNKDFTSLLLKFNNNILNIQSPPVPTQEYINTKKQLLLFLYMLFIFLLFCSRLPNFLFFNISYITSPLRFFSSRVLEILLLTSIVIFIMGFFINFIETYLDSHIKNFDELQNKIIGDIDIGSKVVQLEISFNTIKKKINTIRNTDKAFKALKKCN